MLRALARVALDAFAPRRCAACDAVAPSAICAGCAAAIARSALPPWRRIDRRLAVAAFEFGGGVREALHRGKFRGDRDALGELAGLAAPRLTARLPEPDALVPVPLGARRLRRRGYNQAALVAAALAGRLHVPVATGLERLRETPPQADRDEVERRRNVAGAFGWAGAGLGGARLWLVDDVLTTGATTAAAAAALAQAGAERVDIAVIACVP